LGLGWVRVRIGVRVTVRVRVRIGVRVRVRVRIGVRVRVRVSGSVGLAPHFRMREELPCLVQRYGRGVIRHLVRAMTRVGDGTS